MDSTLAVPPMDPVRSILLVEDDPDLRLLTRHVLAAAGFEVWPAASAEEALEAIRTWSDKGQRREEIPGRTTRAPRPGLPDQLRRVYKEGD